jgi:hypothetical protein
MTTPDAARRWLEEYLGLHRGRPLHTMRKLIGWAIVIAGALIALLRLFK